MKTNFEKVNDFNTCFGHFITDKEYHSIFDENPKLVSLKVSLINEEVQELTDAILTNDIKEIIDALSDIKYVVHGFSGAFGINIDKEFRAHCVKENNVFNANSKKLYDNIVANRIKLTLDNVPWCKYNIDSSSIINNPLISNFNLVKELNKLYFNTTNRKEFYANIHNIHNIYNWDSNKFYGYKSYNYDSKDYYQNLNNSKYRNYIYTIWSNIVRHNENLNSHVKNKYFDEIKESLFKLLYFVEIMGLIIGVDLDASFDIVHSSNMTKICNNEKDAQDTVAWYLKNDKRYSTPSYKKNKYGYIIYNEETGKILKSIYYVPANFDTFIAPYKPIKNDFNPANRWLKNN